MPANDSTTAGADPAVSARSRLQRRWGLLLILGIDQIACGALALVLPVAASLAAAIVFGAVLLASGVTQAVHAFGVRPWKGVVLHTVGSVLYIAAGALFLIFPLAGALTLTLVVAALLLADGVVRSVLAYYLRPRDGWVGFLASGIASAVVGILLLLGWPATGFWALGLLLGVNLLFSGVTNCALAVTFRTSIARDSQQSPLGQAHRHA